MGSLLYHFSTYSGRVYSALVIFMQWTVSVTKNPDISCGVSKIHDKLHKVEHLYNHDTGKLRGPV